MTTQKRILASLMLSLLVAAGCGGKGGKDYGAIGTGLDAGTNTAPPGATPDTGAGNVPQGSAGSSETTPAATPAGSPAASSGGTNGTDAARAGSSTASGSSSARAAATGGQAPGAVSTPAGSSAHAPAGAPKKGPAAGGDKGAAPTPATPVAPSPAPSAGGPGGEIRLGSFGVESGPLGNIMLPIFQSVKAWVADVNARGGLNGHPVKLFLADDAGDPNRTVGIVHRLVEQDKVQAFYGTHAIATLSAVLPYLQQVGVPTIGGCPCQDDPMDENPIAFPLHSSKEGLDWSHLAAFLHYSDAKKVAVIYCRETPSCARITSRMEPVLKQSGREVVYKAEASVAQPDYTAEVIAARNAGAGGVIGVMDFASMIRIAKTAHRQQWQPFISGQWNSFDDRFLTAGGSDIEGAGTSANTVPYTSPKLADYRAAVQRYISGGVFAQGGAHEWVVGKMLEIIAKGFPANPTSKDFIEGLYSLRGETIGGLVPPITYTRDKGHGNSHRCVIPVIIKGGKFVPAGDNLSDFSCPPGYTPSGA